MAKPKKLKTKSDLVASPKSLLGSLVSSFWPRVGVLGFCTDLDNQAYMQTLQPFKNITIPFQSGFKPFYMFPVMHMVSRSLCQRLWKTKLDKPKGGKWTDFMLWMATQPHTAALSLPLTGTGERIRRIDMRKSVGWDKDSLMSQSKSCAHRESKARHSFTTSHGQAGVQLFPGKQGSITWLLGKTNTITLKVFSFLLPGFMCSAWCQMGHSLSQLGSAVPVVPS